MCPAPGPEQTSDGVDPTLVQDYDGNHDNDTIDQLEQLNAPRAAEQPPVELQTTRVVTLKDKVSRMTPDENEDPNDLLVVSYHPFMAIVRELAGGGLQAFHIFAQKLENTIRQDGHTLFQAPAGTVQLLDGERVINGDELAAAVQAGVDEKWAEYNANVLTATEASEQGYVNGYIAAIAGSPPSPELGAEHLANIPVTAAEKAEVQSKAVEEAKRESYASGVTDASNIDQRKLDAAREEGREAGFQEGSQNPVPAPAPAPAPADKGDDKATSSAPAKQK